jgi:hypothetical protein
MKANKTMEGQAVPNHRRRKDKESKSNIIHLHTIKPLNNKINYMTGITTYLPILAMNVNGLNYLSKDTIWQTGLKRKIPQSVVYRRPISLVESSNGLG